MMRKPNLKSDEFEAALADNLRAFERSCGDRQRRTSADLVCLGESHGSHLFALDRKVLPGTGGLLLRAPRFLSDDVLLDPGWGTLATARRFNIALSRVGVILVSHCHLDHTGDLHPLLLTLSLAKKRPLLIGNATTINGARHQPSTLPRYFRELCKDVIVAKPGKEIRAGVLKIIPFSTKHRENRDVSGHSLGYILRFSGSPAHQIGFLSDGPLGRVPSSLMKMLRKCAVLVINIGTISSDLKAPSHSKVFDNALCLHGLELFLTELGKEVGSVKKIAVTHLGAELLEIRAESMKRFLARTNTSDLPNLLQLILKSMVRHALGNGVSTTVLREGNRLEVPK